MVLGSVSASYNAPITKIPKIVTQYTKNSSSCVEVASELQKLGIVGKDVELALIIIKGESTCNVRAQNKVTGAYGLAQALPASKMATHGSDYLTSMSTQLRWTVDYMKQRYGSWSNAYSFWIKKHWW